VFQFKPPVVAPVPVTSTPPAKTAATKVATKQYDLTAQRVQSPKPDMTKFIVPPKPFVAEETFNSMIVEPDTSRVDDVSLVVEVEPERADMEMLLVEVIDSTAKVTAEVEKKVPPPAVKVIDASTEATEATEEVVEVIKHEEQGPSTTEPKVHIQVEDEVDPSTGQRQARPPRSPRILPAEAVVDTTPIGQDVLHGSGVVTEPAIVVDEPTPIDWKPGKKVEFPVIKSFWNEIEAKKEQESQLLTARRGSFQGVAKSPRLGASRSTTPDLKDVKNLPLDEPAPVVESVAESVVELKSEFVVEPVAETEIVKQEPVATEPVPETEQEPVVETGIVEPEPEVKQEPVVEAKSEPEPVAEKVIVEPEPVVESTAEAEIAKSEPEPTPEPRVVTKEATEKTVPPHSGKFDEKALEFTKELAQFKFSGSTETPAMARTFDPFQTPAEQVVKSTGGTTSKPSSLQRPTIHFSNIKSRESPASAQAKHEAEAAISPLAGKTAGSLPTETPYNLLKAFTAASMQETDHKLSSDYEMVSEQNSSEGSGELVEMATESVAENKPATGFSFLAKPADAPATQPFSFGQASGFGQTSSFSFGTADVKGPFTFPTTGFGQATNTVQKSTGFGQTATVAQGSTGFGSTSVFGQPASFGSSIFGQPAKPTGTFSFTAGAPSFASAAQATTSTFGQSSPAQPVFGQTPSSGGFGQNKPLTSVFAQPTSPNAFSSPASSSGFEQSGFGQTQGFGGFGQSGSSGFGQTSTPSTGSGFGQTQGLGGFGQPASLGATSAFDNASKPAESSGFAKYTPSSLLTRIGLVPVVALHSLPAPPHPFCTPLSSH
jgi:hypothetical protein